jgi:hypothetical protein
MLLTAMRYNTLYMMVCVLRRRQTGKFSPNCEQSGTGFGFHVLKTSIKVHRFIFLSLKICKILFCFVYCKEISKLACNGLEISSVRFLYYPLTNNMSQMSNNCKNIFIIPFVRNIKWAYFLKSVNKTNSYFYVAVLLVFGSVYLYCEMQFNGWLSKLFCLRFTFPV